GSLVGSGLFAASDGGPAEWGVVPGGVAGFDVGAAVEQEANGLRAAVVGGGVEGRAAVVAAGLEREGEGEHAADVRSLPVFGRTEDCRALLVGQPPEQSWIIFEQPVGVRAVGAAAGGEEPVCGGRGVGGAVAAEEVGDVGSAGGGGELVGGASVRAGGVRIGCVVEEQLEEVALAASFECRAENRCG